ncbi:hypothetical protein K456DRAFT_46149 [Colletotrichum gloeosporioides 23]|nr:hypothetical protein K456DRAFT_46149 [Colletotrichum gloeosporioides 23]
MTSVSRTGNKKGALESQRCRCYSSSESEDSGRLQKDSCCCYNYRPKKVKKVKKAVKLEESSDSSVIEELGSSEAEESLGKE